MEKALNDYLEKMDKYLKPIPVSERIGIVSEIKSEMQVLQSNRVPTEAIIERLGNPKDLAKAYLGDLISKESKFCWDRFLIICAFYSFVGFSGMIVIPFLGIIAPAFIVCGIATPILGAVKMIDYIFTLNLPYVENIRIFLGGIAAFHPIVEFVISLMIGILIYWAGRGAWKLLVLYCKKISKTARKLSKLRKEVIL